MSVYVCDGVSAVILTCNTSPGAQQGAAAVVWCPLYLPLFTRRLHRSRLLLHRRQHVRLYGSRGL